jgi:hypothetical protein
MSSKHQLSLDIQQTNNCSLFRIVDTSIYSTNLAVDCPTLLITPPGFNQPVSVNVENSGFDILITACNLGLQTEGCGSSSVTLPDGIYFISYSVSPNDKVFVEYQYLRNCQVLNAYYKELCNLELAACEPDADIKDQLDELRLIKSFLDAAKVKVEHCGDITKGMQLFVYAKDRLLKFGRGSCCNRRSGC